MASEIDALVASWKRDLKARNLAPRTVDTYGEATTQFVAWLAEHAPEVDSPDEVSRDQVAGFITHLIVTRSASTASVRSRALQQFFKWLVDEEELEASPMAKMQPPLVPEKPVPVLSDGQFKALFATCAGKTFMDRRDASILRLFADTGVRLAEMANLTLDDVHLDDMVAVVMGKGRRQRAVPFGKKTTRALDRGRTGGPGPPGPAGGTRPVRRQRRCRDGRLGRAQPAVGPGRPVLRHRARVLPAARRS